MLCPRMIPFLLAIALGDLGATTRPHDDPATRMALEMRNYLQDVRVEVVEFRLNEEAKPRLRLSEPDQIAAIVESFTDALAAGDLHEGKQWHTPSRNIHIRFVIENGPDVRLNYVGCDMFWAITSDDVPDSKPEWVNLQTPALTRCLTAQLQQSPATTRPAER